MMPERRNELIDEEIHLVVQEVNLQLRRSARFVESVSGDSEGDRSWGFYAYGYEQAFDAMWDAAYARPNKVLQPALLFICRQSIELSLKAGISALSGKPPPLGHKLKQLWSAFTDALEKLGQPTSDTYSASARILISILDQHDPLGDRFRYPDSTKSGVYLSTVIDLEELYRAHHRVTTYCDAVCT